ncbi:hypothetical protein K439DRAFT_1079064 [Ramaria rubella]|nr:hypothetical protein K439DRAFT_1079064 [Ramaria rubella]
MQSASDPSSLGNENLHGVELSSGSIEDSGGGVSYDYDARDDSSIASSRPGSPAPCWNESQRSGTKQQVSRANSDHSEGVTPDSELWVRFAEEGVEDHHGNGSQAAQATGIQEDWEAEPEPLPGLSSVRHSPPLKGEPSIPRPPSIAAPPAYDGVHGAGKRLEGRDPPLNLSFDRPQDSVDFSGRSCPQSNLAPEKELKSDRGRELTTANSSTVPDSESASSNDDCTSQTPVLISDDTTVSMPHAQLPVASPVDPTHVHVRPSLHMTAQEFSEAKTIILDLLGWGVPSEYLLRYGLAREAIYYAFTELNLKLPSNFDSDGIVPYEPPPVPRNLGPRSPSR